MTPVPSAAAKERRNSGDAQRQPPEAVRVWLLGDFRVSIGSRTIGENEWRLRKAASLVKLLALARGHRTHREVVMDRLWPELSPGAAANNLRRTLHAARRALEPTTPSRYLRTKDEELALCPDGLIWVDVEAFEEAATTARRAREPAAYRAAIELYTGELLPGDRYEDWAEQRRAELRRTYLDLLVELAELHEEREEYGRGIEALRRAVAAEPTREEAHAGLMRLYALSGRRGEALRQYERLDEVLQRELGAEPDANIRRLREEILSGRFPPLRSSAEHPLPENTPGAGLHNLPAQRTSFVGRERDVVEVKRLLSMTGLLTLTGAGGCGKTRLALEVARELVPTYPDGVWLAELAGLSEGTLVPQAVAAAPGVREQPGRPLTDTLAEHLRAKRALLVLDNCEHLIDAAARLADALLNSCLRLRILATSREPLGVAGEVSWTVPPLSVPDAARLPAAEDLKRYEAVRLFVERARHRLPAFEITPHNARTVAEVCRKLDGIPLAIELATARITALAVEQVAERLEDSLKLLTSGARMAAPRQQTMRATLEWSHDLLSEPERKLFRRFSVFAGGWTLEAAEAVGAGEGIEESDVLEVLSGLVNKSLVITERGREAEMRYRMLEPVRQYACEKLEGGEEEEIVRRRHAVFFLDIAERAAPQLKGHRQLLWLERLSREHDDLRAAMRWLLEEGEWEMAVRLGWELYLFWWIRGHFTEGRRWMERALEKGGAAIRPSDRARALYVAGTMATGQADYRQAHQLVEESRELFEQLGDEEGAALALGSAGIAAVGQERYEMGIAFLEEAEGLHRKLGYEWETAAVIALAAGAWLGVGDHDRAAQRAEEALVLARTMGDKTVISAALHVLATVAYASHDRERAKGLFAEGLALAAEMGDSANIAYYLEGLAAVAASEGGLVRAARLWGAAEALLEKIEAAAYTHRADRSLRQARVSAARARLDEESWTAAWSEGTAMSPERAVEYALSAEAPAPPRSKGNSRRIRKDGPPADGPPSEGTLTRRERQIVDLISGGLTTNHQISAELSISERTVETHVRNILKKLKLGSRSQLAALFAEGPSMRANQG